ncbi:dihydrofolate reductase family protein [Corynebacterium ureicelerivorans]|uniref:dihydrofolate reductase family protein n=1 Tax=Corynebacterium ureicelerivorans TaxID=401472 RepID=UPI0026565A13|nr:dihydrofolate reductase family protein [Corynebacterium ureicelerivorans]MDN8604839.1 dihydrofolate reductase family protein [Corynebacterium ureicelerivorans]
MTTCTSDLIGPVLDSAECETRAAMVMTIFGAFGRRGTSAVLGNDLDSQLLHALRSWADVVLVSAGTVTAEAYGSADTPIAILSRSLNIKPNSGVLKGRDAIIVCPESSLLDVTLNNKRAALERAGARFVAAGEGTAAEIVGALHREGFRRIVCEGGPSVYADMIADNQIDVLHITLDPTVSDADGPWGMGNLAQQPPFEDRYTLEATHASDLEADSGDSVLFLRFRSVRER